MTKTNIFSDEEFSSLANKTKMREETKALARLVMVFGMAPIDVARQYGTSRQRVSAAVSTLRKLSESRDLTSGVVTRTIRVPSQLSEPIESFTDHYLLASEESRVEPVRKVKTAIRKATEQLRKTK